MPWLQVVGTYTPPYGPLSAEQEAELFCSLARSKPDILWVGLSTPKQERFMAQYCGRLPVKLMVGVGAAFDLHAGLQERCAALDEAVRAAVAASAGAGATAAGTAISEK